MTADYRIINVNESNLDEYDLFCLKSKKKQEGYQYKVKWAKKRFKEGMRFKLLMVKETKGFTSRGFIEYLPGDVNWRGISAKDYMVIHCIWVVGKHKKKGYGTMLLEECINDARTSGFKGVAVVTTKKTWLPKNKLFIKHGFEKAGEQLGIFELYAKRFSSDYPLPEFNPVKENIQGLQLGITVFNSHQCPYCDNFIRMIRNISEETNIPVDVKIIKNHEEAQRNGMTPYGSFAVVVNGETLTHGFESKKKMMKILEEKGLI
ncbi:MAG: GNAT family N-acetyltransferase [Candidatus Hodarchaeales archaeon]